MSKKILTISVAAYNVALFLKNTLDSLILVDEDRLEVLIVNDGSIDDTAELGLKYEQEYPNIFKVVNKKNGGYGSTINKSIELATGKYFKQLDGDDWYCKDNLKNFIDILEESDSDCVYTPFYQIYEGTNERKISSIEKNISNGVYDLENVNINLLNKILGMHSLTFKTNLLKDNNTLILENCFYTDQEYVIYPFMHARDVKILDIPIYCYRLGQGEQSVSIKGMKRHFRDHYRVVMELLNHYDEIALCSNNKRNAIFERIASLISNQYFLFLIAPKSKKVKAELVEFNRNICKYTEIYNQSLHYDGGVVRLLKKTNFILYPILSIYINMRVK